MSSDEELLSFRCVNGVVVGVVGVTGDVLDSGAIWSSVLILQLTYFGDKNRQHKITKLELNNMASGGQQKHRQEQVSEAKKTTKKHRK